VELDAVNGDGTEVVAAEIDLRHTEGAGHRQAHINGCHPADRRCVHRRGFVAGKDENVGGQGIIIRVGINVRIPDRADLEEVGYPPELPGGRGRRIIRTARGRAGNVNAGKAQRRRSRVVGIGERLSGNRRPRVETDSLSRCRRPEAMQTRSRPQGINVEGAQRLRL